ncbi:MAG: hypothetical protein FJW56_06350 [Actinobacteria bacterium]|nr:hypothetical protein [Actinomycetota bacterium]
MKCSISFILAAIFTLLVVVGCSQNDDKKKELELKEKELALKERELALKEKGLSSDTIQKIKSLESQTPKILSKSQQSDKSIPSQIKKTSVNCEKFIGTWVFNGGDYNCSLIISQNGAKYKIVESCSTGLNNIYSAECVLDKELGLGLRVKDNYGDYTYYCLNESNNTIQPVSPTSMHPIGRETYHKTR